MALFIGIAQDDDLPNDVPLASVEARGAALKGTSVGSRTNIGGEYNRHYDPEITSLDW